jgi:hypothetical protein
MDGSHEGGQDLQPFQTFMRQHLDATLGAYLSALQEALP